MASSTQRARCSHAKESFLTAGEAIGAIQHGMGVFAITRGQWSLIDAILHCFAEVGPSHISIWAWTVAAWEVDMLSVLRQRREILSALLVVDRSAFSKRKDTPTLRVTQDWQAQFGAESVRYITNHAKMVTIESVSGFRLLLRGSMNLNFNPRFEQFDLTEGGDDFILVKKIEAELPVLVTKRPDGEIRALCQITQSMTETQRASFGKLKPWHP